MPDLILWVTAGLIAYLLGSIPTGVILARVLSRPDVRYAGSTHTGGRNVMRVVGRRAGLAATAVDTAKGISAVAIAHWIGAGDVGLVIAATLAVAGHCWPLYTRFHGGMGLATGCGILFWLAPDALAALLITWALLNYLLLHHPARAVGATVILLPLIMLALKKPPELLATGLVVGLIVFIRYVPDFRRVYEQE